ncbi:ArsR family transcriptional regulator [Haloplanus salinus]|jgi:DNA-binding IclR family transcriptional regulator|uniref:ArsR family transcriptional regulator n=1 Tax=Haloplanus salinus TaxID=1126245 RepID=A0A368NDM2_9EURY|nr:helix-turn-helix domain-containing protein [Haloplanus salinus]RCU48210.1 ArsR family transcriptional regulator [Haloplanus salinus]
MVRDPLSGDDPPDLQSVLDALDDPDCRTIIEHLDEPMTANEVSEECDIPMSTTYRKLDLLTEASLLAEGTEIRTDGHHATRYRVDFEAVEIGLTAERVLDISIDRPSRATDERLASLWGEVRKET